MITLEGLLTKPEGFGLVTATPLQRAVCRAIDGIPLGDLKKDKNVITGFGGRDAIRALPRKKALEIVLVAGIRAAKSMIAAASAIQASQECDLSHLGPGETARIPVVSVDKDKAEVVFQHILGNVRASPQLQHLLVGEPTTDTLYLQHPSGRLVEIVVTAGRKAGSSLVGRWLAGAIFDEAPRMAGVDEGVVNLEHSRRAILGRMLEGAQILYIGSPWAPLGPVYEWVEASHGQPTEERVVIVAPGPAMNPVHWTPKRIEQVKKSDPLAYQTDVLGKFADLEDSFFASDDVDACRREKPDVVLPKERHHYVAAMDPATRSNAWTLCVMTCTGLGGAGGIQPCYEVVVAKQWMPVPGVPLRPKLILKEIADLLEPYGVDTVTTDQWAADALTDIADEFGLSIRDETTNGKNKHDLAADLRVLIQDADDVPRIILPPDHQLRRDLLSVKRRVTKDGVSIIYPKQGARHCDYVPSLAACLAFPPDAPDDPPRFVDKMLEAARARVDEAQSGDWVEQIANRYSRGQ